MTDIRLSGVVALINGNKLAILIPLQQHSGINPDVYWNSWGIIGENGCFAKKFDVIPEVCQNSSGIK